MPADKQPDPLALADELSRAAGWPFAAPQGALTSAAAELRRLAAIEAEHDALKADAARYRWLRSEDPTKQLHAFWQRAAKDRTMTLEVLDACVDAAMARA